MLTLSFRTRRHFLLTLTGIFLIIPEARIVNHKELRDVWNETVEANLSLSAKA